MRLRITAQLIDSQTDYPFWSERYDRELQDIFDVQAEIAQYRGRDADHTFPEEHLPIVSGKG
jgi:TolB-like protein